MSPIADNVGIATGADATVASDDVGGVHYQRIKIDLGTDGAASPLLRGQQAKANSLPVALASDDDSLTYLSAIATSLAALDNGVSGNELQVDVVAALPAGTNAIGKLAANSGVDIGDVDVTSIAAGDNVVGRVKISDGTDLLLIDSSGRATVSIDAATIAVPVTDNSGSLTVDILASAAGGCEVFFSADLDETEEDVATGACTLYGWAMSNRTTAPLYIHFYNATAANVTVGTTAPAFIFELPANATDHVAANMAFPMGVAFPTALSVAATTDFPDDGTPAGPAANGCAVALFFKD